MEEAGKDNCSYAKARKYPESVPGSCAQGRNGGTNIKDKNSIAN
jgi:hypothetical protein